jgi:NAD-dependent deacetylase sirtuin 4
MLSRAARVPALVSRAPSSLPADAAELGALYRYILEARHLVVLSGAGISTHSGIPDYRSPGGSYSKGHVPIKHAEFVGSDVARRRYWARSFVGWQYFSRAEPNAAHHALAELEQMGRLRAVVTQNVDGLHTAAGQRSVLDLHGRIDRVVCLQCGATSARAALQSRLASANVAWARQREAATPSELRADGDAELSEAEVEHFAVPACEGCGDGVLKPDVTFFGGAIPPSITQQAAETVAAADALLVVGSSLEVFSAFRLARAAAAACAPLLLLTNGPTRADELATLRMRCDAAEVLPVIADALRG